jgi:hypothetical protein
VYTSHSSLILGFHGCDRSVGEKVLGGARLKHSKNDYDWLGSGIYFWENNPHRALEYAELLRDNPHRIKGKAINDPFVVGAVIDLGFCLDLLEHRSLRLVSESYRTLKAAFDEVGKTLPANVSVGNEKDLLLRPLDCAVIESLHQAREEEHKISFDSVRGMFPEGDQLYDGAGFRSHSHIQICLRNPNCIKGYFRVLNPVNSYRIP